MVDKGQISEPLESLTSRQLPQAKISPPLFINSCIFSVTRNLSVSIDSHSTPFARRNTLTVSPSFKAKIHSLKAFQTVSESFE